MLNKCFAIFLVQNRNNANRLKKGKIPISVLPASYHWSRINQSVGCYVAQWQVPTTSSRHDNNGETKD